MSGTWYGQFEREENGEGSRVYRLRWLPAQPAERDDPSLSEREVAKALFIRYLIGRGKIGETIGG